MAVSREGRLLAASSHGAEGKGAPWGLLFQGSNPIHEGPTLMTESPPQVPPAQHCHLEAPVLPGSGLEKSVCAYGQGDGHWHSGVETWFEKESGCLIFRELFRVGEASLFLG